jgi:hypothetical protein
LYALLEIQIEGKNGWARHLPTFRINVFFKKLLGGKPLTGYHIYMLLTFIVVFNAMMHEEVSLKNEFNIIGYLSIFFVLEDMFWFILNPHYTLKRFIQKDIKWHKRWLFGLPISYWVGILIMSLMFYLGR